MEPARGERVPEPPPHAGMAVSSGNDADGCCRTRRRFGPRLRQDDEQQGMNRHVLQHVQNAQRPARRRSSTPQPEIWRGLDTCTSRTIPPRSIPPRPRAQAPGGGHNEQNPLLGACPGADSLKTGWVTASGYNIISTVRRGDHAPHRGHPRFPPGSAAMKSAGSSRPGSSPAPTRHRSLRAYQIQLFQQSHSVIRQKHKIRPQQGHRAGIPQNGKELKNWGREGDFLQNPPFPKPHPSPSKTFDLIESLMESPRALKG